MIRRRAALAGLATGLAGLAVPHAARANRRVTVIVGAQPGSRLAEMTHSVIPFLSRHWARTDIALRFIPGEGGLHALRALAESIPSGATLSWVASPSIPARIVDRGGEDVLARIALLGVVLREPIAFVSPMSAPVNSVQDLIRRASDDADAVPLGTPPPGSPPHLAALRLQAVAQTRLNIVTFPSAAAARQAVIAGNVSAGVLGLSDVIAALRDDRLHGIGLASRNRFGTLPDMPVLSEAGVPLATSIRRGFAVPVGLPADVVAPILDTLRAMTADPDFKAFAETSGFVPVWQDGAAWDRVITAERTELSKLWLTEPWLPSSSG